MNACSEIQFRSYLTSFSLEASDAPGPLSLRYDVWIGSQLAGAAHHDGCLDYGPANVGRLLTLVMDASTAAEIKIGAQAQD